MSQGNVIQFLPKLSRIQTGAQNSARNIQQAIPPAAQVCWFAKAVTYQIKLWNANCVKTGRHFLMLKADSVALAFLKDGQYAQEFSALANKKGFQYALENTDGLLIYEDKIESVQSLLVELISDKVNGKGKKPSISFEGQTQWGKTMVLICTLLLGNLLLKNHRIPELLYIINTMRNGANKELEGDYPRYYEFLSPIIYADNSQNNVYKATPAKQFVHMKRNWGHVNVGALNPNKQGFFESLKRDELSPIFMFDEGDEGCGVGSLTDKMLKESRQRGFHNTRAVYVTATANDYNALENMTSIKAPLPGDDYSGFYHGTQFPVAGLGDLAKATGIAKLANFNLRDHWATGANAVAQAIMTTMKVGINLPGFTGTPCNGGRGLMVRYGKQTQADKLVKALKKQIGGDESIVVLKYYRDYILKDKTIRGAIAELAPDNTRYIIVVSGTARRADRLPGHLTVFIDFARKITTDKAARQGFGGRASGYYKYSDTHSTCVFYTDEIADLIQNNRRLFAIDGLERPFGKPSRYATDVSNEPKISGRKQMQVRVQMDVFPVLKARVEKTLLEYVSWSSKKCNIIKASLDVNPSMIVKSSTSQFTNKPVWYFDLLKLLGRDGIADIEDYASLRHGREVKIMLAGQNSPSGKFMSADESGRIEIRFGNEHRGQNNPALGKNRKIKGEETGLRGSRATSTRNNVKGYKDVRVITAMFVKDKTGNINLASMTFHSLHETRGHSTAVGDLLPNDKHHLRTLRTASEKGRVDRAQARRRKKAA